MNKNMIMLQVGNKSKIQGFKTKNYVKNYGFINKYIAKCWIINGEI